MDIEDYLVLFSFMFLSLAAFFILISILSASFQENQLDYTGKYLRKAELITPIITGQPGRQIRVLDQSGTDKRNVSQSLGRKLIILRFTMLLLFILNHFKSVWYIGISSRGIPCLRENA